MKNLVDKIVMVWWTDARTMSGWHGAEEVDAWMNDWRGREIMTTGRVLRFDKAGLVLCMSRDGSAAWVGSSFLEIPRPMIRKISEVKLGRSVFKRR